MMPLYKNKRHSEKTRISIFLRRHFCIARFYFKFAVRRASKCSNRGCTLKQSLSSPAFHVLHETSFNNYCKQLSIKEPLRQFAWVRPVPLCVCVCVCVFPKIIIHHLEHPLGDNRRNITWWDLISPASRSSHYLCSAT